MVKRSDTTGNRPKAGIYPEGIAAGSSAAIPPGSIPWSCAAAQFPEAPSAPGSQPAAADWTGVCLLELSASERSGLKIDDLPGAVVAGVYPGSPAEAAELGIGDLIVEINNLAITSGEQLANRNEPVISEPVSAGASTSQDPGSYF